LFLVVVKAAIVLGCIYPQAFFTKAGGGADAADAGATCDVIKEEGRQVTSISVSIESNRGSKSPTFIPSSI